MFIIINKELPDGEEVNSQLKYILNNGVDEDRIDSDSSCDRCVTVVQSVKYLICELEVRKQLTKHFEERIVEQKGLY